MKYISIICLGLMMCLSHSATSQMININYEAPVQPIPDIYQPGIFLVPKTLNGGNDFLNNGVHFNSIRTIDIEEAMNYWTVSSIAGVMLQLEAQKSNILIADSRCDKLVIPILKMPAWLSSSSDNTPAGPGFEVLNAVPPANYTTWNTLMDSIVEKINNQWGLDPYYEIWNEPDGDYWQGTEAEYFEFYKNTLSAIKSNHPTSKVGGPTVSNFRSKFGSSFGGGYLTNAQLDSSIIGRVIDSCVTWGLTMDFISWHKFEASVYAMDMEMDYLNQKLVNSGHGVVPFIVSEWNLSFSFIESAVDPAFMINYVEAMNQHNISGEMVAAWQDFEEGTEEFHEGYGLLSWGALHKPSWKALLLLNKLGGVRLDVDSTNYRSLNTLSSYENDTLKVLVSNYSVPGFAAASFSLYFDFEISQSDLGDAGYTPGKLDSVYQGLIVLTGTDYLSTSINSVIPLYQPAESYFQNGRDVDLNFPGLIGIHTGIRTVIDSSRNNVIHVFDSLITDGYTRTTAVNYLYPNNNFDVGTVSMTDSTYSFHIQPNGVALLEFYMPDISVSNKEIELSSNPKIYPNPTSGVFTIVNSGIYESIIIYNLTGQVVYEQKSQNTNTTDIDLSNQPEGIYFVHLQEENGYNRAIKLIKSE